MLNALRFGANCSAFWCKTQGEMQQNAGWNVYNCTVGMGLKPCRLVENGWKIGVKGT